MAWRGLPVELPEEFRNRAVECLSWARATLSDRARVGWLSMAQFWLQRAQSAEQLKDKDNGGPQPPLPQEPDARLQSQSPD